MDDLIAILVIPSGKVFSIPMGEGETWSVSALFTNHLLADLVALLAQQDLKSFNRSFRQKQPNPDNLFPYFHMAECESERELRRRMIPLCAKVS